MAGLTVLLGARPVDAAAVAALVLEQELLLVRLGAGGGPGALVDGLVEGAEEVHELGHVGRHRHGLHDALQLLHVAGHGLLAGQVAQSLPGVPLGLGHHFPESGLGLPARTLLGLLEQGVEAQHHLRRRLERP